MYCSSCGTAVTQGLRFCNRCGADLRTGLPILSEASVQSIVWAIASVTIVGLGVVIGLMAVMKEVLHFNDGLIIAFSFLSFLTMLGVDLVFIWVLLRPRAAAKKAGGINQEKKITSRELGEANGQLLPESPVSVTEHTTRTLEPAGLQHKSE